MRRPVKKVKGSQAKRYRATLEKTVTFRLTTVIEVDVPPSASPVGKWHILHAAQAALEAERIAGIEREWSTKFVDGNREFFVDEASIQEVEPHMTCTEKT